LRTWGFYCDGRHWEHLWWSTISMSSWHLTFQRLCLHRQALMQCLVFARYICTAVSVNTAC
jgi:hypothetical protein